MPKGSSVPWPSWSVDDMLFGFLAAAFTFTASATGLAKGSTVEFLFIGKDSDRAYEAMFAIDMSIADFTTALEKAGIKPGQAIDLARCHVWPVGTPVSFSPDIANFISVDNSDGFSLGRIIYTGGLRNSDNVPVSETEMPASVCSFYSLGQSLFVPENVIDQGAAYGRFQAKQSIKKGTRYAFTISWNDADLSRHVEIHATQDNTIELIKKLKDESRSSNIDVLASFDEEMTVAQATAFAAALDLVDSVRVKITGCRPGSLFFRAFLPLVKWTERQNRMVQPFELTLTSDDSELVFIEEDWSVDGNDPKLTPKKISFSEAANKQSTDTCFIFASKDTKLSRIYSAMEKLKDSSVKNWYVFPRD